MVPKFISRVLYEGLRTFGLQMGQFNFPRVLITLVRQGKEHSVRGSKGNRQLESGGGGTLITYDILDIILKTNKEMMRLYDFLPRGEQLTANV